MDQRQENLEKRAEIRDKRARDLEKEREDDRDRWRYRRYRDDWGTTYSSDYWDDYYSEDYCEAEVVVDGVTHYQCEGVWYRRAYVDGEVSYVVVEGPRSD